MYKYFYSILLAFMVDNNLNMLITSYLVFFYLDIFFSQLWDQKVQHCSVIFLHSHEKAATDLNMNSGNFTINWAYFWKEICHIWFSASLSAIPVVLQNSCHQMPPNSTTRRNISEFYLHPWTVLHKRLNPLEYTCTTLNNDVTLMMQRVFYIVSRCSMHRIYYYYYY